MEAVKRKFENLRLVSNNVDFDGEQIASRRRGQVGAGRARLPEQLYAREVVRVASNQVAHVVRQALLIGGLVARAGAEHHR